MNPKLDAVFRCPEDNVQQRNSFADNSHGYYRYSYAMNNMYCSSTKLPSQRADGVFTGKFGSIRRPSEKVLFICEDEKTLDDGAFSPKAMNLQKDDIRALAREMVATIVPNGSSESMNAVT